MTVILHLSDTHFGTQQPQVVEALLRLARTQQPDVAILSGDITQRAFGQQFDAARAFMDRLPATVKLVIPGNHDVPLFNPIARLIAPYYGFKRCFGKVLEPRHESENLLVIGLKTTRRWRHVQGEVSPEQIERSAGQLRAASTRQLRIIVTHQPVHVPKLKDEKNLLRGHAQALDAWSAAGADLILGGHIHLPYIHELSERHPRLRRRLWCVQAGTATSWRVRHEAPNSVNLIRYDGNAQHCEAERWDFDASAQDFHLHSARRLELERAG